MALAPSCHNPRRRQRVVCVLVPWAHGSYGCLHSPENPLFGVAVLGPGTLNSGATGSLAGVVSGGPQESGSHRPLGPWSRPADQACVPGWT